MVKTQCAFSYCITGYAAMFDRKSTGFSVKTTGNREFLITLTPTTFIRMYRSLDESYIDCAGQLADLFKKDQYLFVYGFFSSQAVNSLNFNSKVKIHVQ